MTDRARTHLLQVEEILVLVPVSIGLGGVDVVPVLQPGGYAGQPALGPPGVVDEGELHQGGEDKGCAGPHPDVDCLIVNCCKCK